MNRVPGGSCPFCGSEVGWKVGQQGITFVICGPCGAVVSFAQLKDEQGPPLTPHEAIAAYKRRAQTPAPGTCQHGYPQTMRCSRCGE